MAQEVLLYISLIIIIAAVLTVIARIVRQPPIIAYLAAGIIISPLLLGPHLLGIIGEGNAASELIQIFAHIGVAFLLFIVGLSLDFRVLREIGGVASIAGITEIAITGGIGALIALGLGYSNTVVIYLGAALAFSSTVVIVKILSDKKEMDTLHGHIALGILIIEDFVAALALMAVPLLENNGNILAIAGKIGIAVSVSAAVFFIAYMVLPRIMDYLARNQEGLFLFGIAWALSLATLFDSLGFSLEIGALIAGMSLASSKYTLDLGGKIKPLRDFFVVLFFVFFGSQLVGPITPELIKHSVIFSAFIIIGKPLIVMTILRFFGYGRRTNFLAGSSLAQISEFSLILALLGFSLGHLTPQIMNLLILISVITICVSSYTIHHAHSIFAKLDNMLKIFEGRRNNASEKTKKEYKVILFGYHRIGYKIGQTLKKMGTSFVVVDHNPKVILSLTKEKVDSIYGDGGDKDFLSQLPLDKADLVISTLPDVSANLAIKEKLTAIKSKAAFIATAEQPRAAVDLYNAGVDYVLIPHHLGGQYASEMIEKFRTEKAHYQNMGKKHRELLQKGKEKSNYA